MSRTQSQSVESDGQETSLDLDANVLAGLAYLFTIVSGVLVLLLEEKNDLARFHAAQSIVLSVAIFGVWFVFRVVEMAIHTALGGIPLIGFLFGLMLSVVWAVIVLGALIAWLYAMIRAFQGERTKLPVLGDLAENTLL